VLSALHVNSASSMIQISCHGGGKQLGKILQTKWLVGADHLQGIFDPLFEFPAPPTKSTGFESEFLCHHVRLLASSTRVMMGPAPPENAFLPKSKDVLPRVIASWTTGISVP
jgi:hypothetical protein